MKTMTCQPTDVDVPPNDPTRVPRTDGPHNYHQTGVLPVLQTKEQTKAFYDKIARIYDLLAEHSEQPMRRAGLDMLQARAGEKILEIGFGTGHCLIELARSVTSSGRVFGLDLSEKMKQVAATRARDQGWDNVIELSCGDALHLPYARASLDSKQQHRNRQGDLP